MRIRTIWLARSRVKKPAAAASRGSNLGDLVFHIAVRSQRNGRNDLTEHSKKALSFILGHPVGVVMVSSVAHICLKRETSFCHASGPAISNRSSATAIVGVAREGARHRIAPRSARGNKSVMDSRPRRRPPQDGWKRDVVATAFAAAIPLIAIPPGRARGCAPESTNEQTSESLVWSSAH